MFAALFGSECERNDIVSSSIVVVLPVLTTDPYSAQTFYVLLVYIC